jgi:hypothetical protein
MSSQLLSENYAGARAVLATMHGKENAVSLPFRSHLRLVVVVPEYMDTDAFGSLTDEVERSGTLLETARRKALAGMQATGLRIGLASEGEFSRASAPVLGHEVLLFLDADRGIELVEELHDAPTNYREWLVSDTSPVVEDLDAFGFPGHRLTVRPNQGDLTGMVFKGIGNLHLLGMAIEMARGHSPDSLARVSTDMRAHRNPTRMRVISDLADRLALRIAAL